jgi:hypothetical protein
MLRSPPTRISSGARNPTFRKSRVSGWTSKRSISDFVKQVKGSSSHLISHEIRSGFLFKWQGSYGALTVSKGGVDDLCEYIDRQEEHHRRKSLIPDWEPIWMVKWGRTIEIVAGVAKSAKADWNFLTRVSIIYSSHCPYYYHRS